MRRVVAAFLCCLFVPASGLFLPVSVHAATDAPASTRLVKVHFVQDIADAHMVKLLGGDGNRLFVAKRNGVAEIITLGKGGKRRRVTLQARDRRGKHTLEQPEAAVEANGVIYVVDSGKNRVAMFSAKGKFKGSFGEKGSDPGELSEPRGIAWQDGIVYVADSGNGRIELYGDNGVFLNALEIEGNPANKRFKEKDVEYTLGKPLAVAVDRKGLIYVLDVGGSFFSSHTTIKVYNAAGVYQRQFSKNGKPVAMRVAQDAVYVADGADSAIQKYTLDGRLESSFGSKGQGRGQFRGLAGLTVTNGHIYIGDGLANAIHDFAIGAAPSGVREPPRTDSIFMRWKGAIPANVGKMAWNGKDTLYAVSRDGSAIARFRNGKAEKPLKLEGIRPVALAFDGQGALWVLDKSMRVIELDATGKPALTFGSLGLQRGQFRNASDIAISRAGVVFVADTGNHRVQAFGTDGVLVDVITRDSGKKLSEPSALALDPDNNLYVLDTDDGIVARYNAALESTGRFGQGDAFEAHNLKDPVGIAATDTEVMVLQEARVKVFSHRGKYRRSFGAPGEGRGEFDEARAIAMAGDTAVAVADKGNDRVALFNTLYKPMAPDMVTARDAAHAVDLSWAVSPLPYVGQYEIYRAASEEGPFIRVGASTSTKYADEGLKPGRKYYYVVTSRSKAGFEGLPSGPVNGLVLKYNPPPLTDVKVTSAPLEVKLRWGPLDARYVAAYEVYKKSDGSFVKVGESLSPHFTVDNLTPGTDYTFFLATRSVDGIESQKQAVEARTTVDTSTPLEISVAKLDNVFSNTYKVYEQTGVGTVKLTNNTNRVQKNIDVSFMLNNFMDYPTETRIDSLAPGESKSVTLKAVFNNTILTLTEDTPVQVKIEASYFENGKKQSFNKIRTINVYDKHRLVWSDPDRYAAFITPKDPVIVDFTRSVASAFRTIKDPTQLAAAVFDTLGTLGVTYVQDPTNPYQVSSRKVDTVDYIEYPREAITRKSGDCDDLVALYSASLEAMGISTRALLVPGHMFMMFNTGVLADPDHYTMDNMYVIHDGTLWVPVETTLVGKSFTKAWESGANSWYKWKDRGLTVFDPHQAWQTYKPATLPDANWQPPEKTRADVDKAFPGDSAAVLKISSQTKTRRYMQALRNNPDDLNAHLQIGIIMARAGAPDEAMKHFDRILSAQPKNADALNGKGNVYMIEGQYGSAQKYYRAAAKADPHDAELLVNLTQAYMAGKNVKAAKRTFARAKRLDRQVARRHKALSLELKGTYTRGRRRHAAHASGRKHHHHAAKARKRRSHH